MTGSFTILKMDTRVAETYGLSLYNKLTFI